MKKRARGPMASAWRKAALVAALFAIPRCTCGGTSSTPDCSVDTAPNATFQLEDGFCGGQYCAMTCNQGFLDCNDDTSDGCETPSSPDPSLHETVSGGSSLGGGGCGGGGSSSIAMTGSCNVSCQLGWFNCDGNLANGCESQHCDTSPFADVNVDSPDVVTPSVPQELAALVADPRGLVVCSGYDFYFDGSNLQSIDSTTLANALVTVSPSLPSGGLACDGTYLYWTTLSTADAGPPNGSLFRLAIGSGTPEPVVQGLNPGRGIDFSDRVYFIVRNPVGPSTVVASTDSGLEAWLPVVETSAYKPFTLATSDDWALASGTIYRRPHGGAVGVWIEDAGPASALLTTEAGLPIVVLGVQDDSGAPDASDDASDDAAEASTLVPDFFAQLSDDAGHPALVAAGTLVHSIVATTTSTTTIIAASDDVVYAISLPDGTIASQWAVTGHVADVAEDATWAVWTTRGNGPPTTGHVWRAKIE